MEHTVRHSKVGAKSVQRLNESTLLVEMDEVYTGWFEISNLVGNANETVIFSTSATANVTLECVYLCHW